HHVRIDIHFDSGKITGLETQIASDREGNTRYCEQNNSEPELYQIDRSSCHSTLNLEAKQLFWTALTNVPAPMRKRERSRRVLQRLCWSADWRTRGNLIPC